MRGSRSRCERVGVDEDLVTSEVDHRRAGDADHRRDVAAGQVIGWNRGRQVARPQDLPGAGGQRVDRVVLGRGDDAAVGDQRFAV
jgi:hypothetical protein